MFLISIALTAVMYFLTLWMCDVVRRGRPFGGCFVLAIPCWLFLWFAQLVTYPWASYAPFGCGAILLVACFFSMTGIIKRRVRIPALIGMVAMYATVAIPAALQVHRQVDLRSQYPFQSLTERVANRRLSRGANVAPTRERPPAWSFAVVNDAKEAISIDPTHENYLKQVAKTIDAGKQTSEVSSKSLLDELESNFAYRSWEQDRASSIKWIHQGYVRQFTDSIGFGAERLRSPPHTPERFLGENDRIAVIPQPAELPKADSATPDPSAPSRPKVARPKSPAPDTEELTGLHLAGLTDFFDPDDFGYVKSVGEVAGFRPHHFKRMPTFDGPQQANRPPAVRDGAPRAPKAASAWVVQRLELVGLLLHKEAVVYVSDSLPNMEQLGDLKTRPLDLFEEEGLTRLEAGDDLFSIESENDLRLLGAIRAAKDCLKCHAARRGDLLGAFSYRLRRDPPLPPPKPGSGPKT